MNKDEPAFPTQMWDEELKEATWLDGGLTKREYFAGLAMNGLMQRNHGIDQHQCATIAVAFANSLIKELDKPVNE